MAPPFSDRLARWLCHARCDGDPAAVEHLIAQAPAGGAAVELAFVIRDRPELEAWLVAASGGGDASPPLVDTPAAYAQTAGSVVFQSRLLPVGVARLSIDEWDSLLASDAIESFSVATPTRLAEPMDNGEE